MISFSYLIVPLLSLILFIFFFFKWYGNPSSAARTRLPPTPPKLPVIGNLHQLGLLPHRSLQALSKRYGPLMLLHHGRVPVLIVSSADAAREIMKNQDVIFSNRPKLSVIDKVIYGSRDIAFAPYGEYWRQVRSICVLHVLNNKRVQSFRHIREEEMFLMIEKIRHYSSYSINFSNILVMLTNDIISRVARGRKYSDGEAGGSTKFELLVKEVSELVGIFSPGDYVPGLNWIKRVNGFEAAVEKLARRVDEFLEGVVAEH